MSSQFRTIIDSKYNNSRSTMIRWEKTIDFLRPLPNVNAGLDLGDRTPLTRNLEKFFNCSFDNTDNDLDTEKLNGQYEVVTSFEVIEHLFNPLHNLLEIRRVLKPRGILYLSTPVGKPNILSSPEHFNEMSTRSLNALMDRAGFKIL